jgi:hypothetical protein
LQLNKDVGQIAVVIRNLLELNQRLGK